MSPEVELCVISDYSQKCTIPARYFSLLNVKFDYVTISCSADYAVVNRAYPCYYMRNVVVASDVVSKRNRESPVPLPKMLYCALDSIKSNKLVCLKKIKIQVVMRSIADIVNWQFIPDLETLVKSILLQYGVIKGSLVKADKQHTQIGVLEINVLDTYSGENVGITTENTEVEIANVTSGNHVEQLQAFQHLQLGGLDEILARMKNYFAFTCSDAKHRSCSKLLVTGPSGCGKTSLVRRFALDTNSYLIEVSERDICHMDKSDLINLYQVLHKAAFLRDEMPCILFVDNLNVVSDKNEEKRKVLYLLLAMIDLASKYQNVPVIGAATSSKFVHREFTRPGRFSKEIRIGVPTHKQREEILRVMTKNFSSDINVSAIAKLTPGFVGADLSLLCLEARQNATGKSENACVTMEDLEKASMIVKPSLLKKSRFVTNVQSVHWEDIGGMDDIKKRVTMSIEWPLTHPEVFSKVGLQCPKGVLLYGPPGCCKTTLVRVLATECHATFFSASPAQIYSPYVGDSEKSILELFHEARLCAPSIIFLDEIDNLVGKRSYASKQSGVQEKVLSALLNEMDGFGVDVDSYQDISEASSESLEINNRNVIVVGATNRIDLIDDALLRPGRFDSVLYVPPPNKQQREAILKLLTRKMKLQDVDLGWVAEKTNRFSGADLKNLCRIVALSAFKASSSLTCVHFETALKIAHPSITESQLKEYECIAAKYGPTSHIQ